MKDVSARPDGGISAAGISGGIAVRKIISSVLGLLICAFALSGCSNGGEPFEEKTYTPDAQVREINLNVRDREIELVPSGDGQVHIRYSENSKEYYEISVSDEGALTMTGASDKEWTDYIGGKAPAGDRKILLQIPDALLENLTLSTTNEDITLPELSVNGSVALASNGGNIAFEGLNVGAALSLTAKNGTIEGTVAGSYDDFAIQTEIKNGDCNLPGSKPRGEKALNVSCNNGDVVIEFAGS